MYDLPYPGAALSITWLAEKVDVCCTDTNLWQVTFLFFTQLRFTPHFPAQIGGDYYLPREREIVFYLH